MKTFSRLLIALFLFSVISCKKDGGSSPSSPLLGTWNIVSDEIKEYQNGTLVSDEVLTGADADEKSIRFDNNNTALVTGSDNTASTESYNYDSQNKVLVLGDQSVQVPTLTSSSLVMLLVDPSNGGPDREEVFITWKR